MPLAQHRFGRFWSTPKGVLTKTAPDGPYEGILHRAFVVARDVTRTFPFPVSSKTLAFAASTVAFFRKIVSMSAFAQNLYAAEEDAATRVQPAASTPTALPAPTAASLPPAVALAPAAQSNVGFSSPSDAKIAASQPLEPALEQMLRTSQISQDLIQIIRVQGVNDRETFVSLADSVPEFREAAKDLFGIDTAKGPQHRLMQARIVKAWNASKHYSEAQLKVDANAKAHGETITMPSSDWMSLIDQFRAKYGAHIHESCLPAQSYYEAFEEKLADGQLGAETLAQVISFAEEEHQRSQKPEPSRHLGLHLDSTLTIQTRRRYISSAPTSTEELRDKYVIMSNMWLLAQMRQPGRHLYADLTPQTWSDLLSELLSTRNFRLDREVGGVKLVVPQWSHCLEYEFQIRKEAISLTRSRGLSIQSALWSVYRNEHHRMEHWVTLLTIANAASSMSVPPAVASQMAAMQKRMTALENRDRSRTPAPRQSAKAATQQSANSKGQGKGKKPKGSKGKGKSSASANPQTAGFKKFHIIKGVPAVSAHFDPRDGQQPGICYNFNSNKACPTTPCSRLHVCIGCGKVATPYDNCGCLERYT